MRHSMLRKRRKETPTISRHNTKNIGRDCIPRKYKERSGGDKKCRIESGKIDEAFMLGE